VVRGAGSCRVSGPPDWAALALLSVPPPTAGAERGLPSTARVSVAPHAGRPRPGLSCAAGCTGGSQNTSYAARAAFVFWDGPVLVPAARTGARTCRCALGRPRYAGAVLVGRWPLSSVLGWCFPLHKRLPPPTRPSAPPALQTSGSLALLAGSHPSWVRAFSQQRLP
jgi:hypothetical protein